MSGLCCSPFSHWHHPSASTLPVIVRLIARALLISSLFLTRLYYALSFIALPPSPSFRLSFFHSQTHSRINYQPISLSVYLPRFPSPLESSPSISLLLFIFLSFLCFFFLSLSYVDFFSFASMLCPQFIALPLHFFLFFFFFHS